MSDYALQFMELTSDLDDLLTDIRENQIAARSQLDQDGTGPNTMVEDGPPSGLEGYAMQVLIEATTRLSAAIRELNANGIVAKLTTLDAENEL